jgi:hypothetical protein
MIVGWAEIVSFSFPGHFCSMGSGFWIVIKSGYCGLWVVIWFRSFELADLCSRKLR